jgi:hypothetical protein
LGNVGLKYGKIRFSFVVPKACWKCHRYYPSVCLERLRKTTNIISQDSSFLGQDLNPGPSE